MTRPNPVTWSRAHPLAADTAFAMLLAAVTVAAVVTSGPAADARDPDGWAVVLDLGAVLPVAARRARPIAMLWCSTLAQMLFSGLDYAGAGWIGPLVMLYTVASRVRGPRRVRHAAAVLTLVGVFVIVGVVNKVADWGAIPGTYISAATAYVVGDNVRRRRERIADLAERAERAEREQEFIARQRIAEERRRIARELHDVVAHSLSVMVIQAAAARRQITRQPERAAEALHTIEIHGHQAMNEMRRVLGVLRSDAESADLAPVPSLGDLPALLAGDPESQVTLRVEGSLDGLPAGVGLSAYRIVQEALTNVRKHGGPGASAVVAAARGERELTVEIADRGRGASALAPSTDGLGLLGMRERVAACGGRLETGPRPGGGWIVRARFPLDASALDPPDRHAALT